MANVLRRDRQLLVLRLLCEGNSIRSTERITGVHRDTVMRVMVRAGESCRSMLDDMMRNLTLRHVQCDEIWTFVAKKQGRLTQEERAERSDIGDVYLWVAFDEDTKLVPTFAIGKRSADMARRFMMDLATRLKMPAPHESDRHAFGAGWHRPITQISTDAFAGYPEAVDLAFGPYVRYGQIVKNYRNTDQPGRYGPPEMIGTDRRIIFGSLNEFEIGTSHVERNNLTIRTFVKRFTRLSLGFSKKLENLCAAVSLHMAYHNCCWRPRFPDGSGMTGRRRPTPAMLAGVTDHLWSFEELFQRIAQ